MTNYINKVPFLRTSIEFSGDAEALAFQVNKAYVDMANSINERTIALYPSTRPAITGNTWYITGNQRQLTFRQIYPFTSAGSIPHGINTSFIAGFAQIYGTFTDGTNFYPLPYVSTTAANQISISVTPTNIVITAGGGAPSITSGYVVLEWISDR